MPGEVRARPSVSKTHRKVMSGERVFREYWACGACLVEVQHDDKFCRMCGANFQ